VCDCCAGSLVDCRQGGLVREAASTYGLNAPGELTLNVPGELTLNLLDIHDIMRHVACHGLAIKMSPSQQAALSEVTHMLNPTTTMAWLTCDSLHSAPSGVYTPPP
jgi:hypothetical protein